MENPSLNEVAKVKHNFINENGRYPDKIEFSPQFYGKLCAELEDEYGVAGDTILGMKVWLIF